MKYLCLVVLILSLIPFLGGRASAALKESDLQKNVVLTEEAALLSQVDAVSLYMHSDKVAYAPRLGSDNIIEVEATVLNERLLSDEGRLKKFVSRQIETFISVLKERLPIYAPTISAIFDENTDVRFTINAGGRRTPVAAWSAGNWSWDAGWGQQAVPAYSSGEEVEPEDKGKLGCNCPARR